MTFRATLLALALSVAFLTGCMGEDNGQAPRDPGTGPGPGPSPSDPPPGTTPPGQTPPPAGTPDPTLPPGEPWQWPPLEEATVRPGVQIVSDSGQCTSNFVFLDPFNTTVYLGFAAHCVAGGGSTDTNGCSTSVTPHELGTEVDVEGATRPATLVYHSWGTMQAVNETDGAACRLNDFAVVELHPDDHALVHPAMLTFGGPTGYAGSVTVGDKVLTFGNTGLRPGPSQLDAREGYVLSSSTWTTTIYTVTPGLPGDSGSGAMTAEGEALGVLVTLGLLPFAGSNGVTTLSTAVAYANEHAGLDLRLGTWELLDGGILP